MVFVNMLVVNLRGFMFFLFCVCIGICSIIVLFFCLVWSVILEVSGVCGSIEKVIFLGREKVVILDGLYFRLFNIIIMFDFVFIWRLVSLYKIKII